MLPATVDVVNHPLGDGSAIVVPKIREQNGTSTYKYIAPSGDELTIDVRHSLEKKVGSVQYERHNFDVKYVVFNQQDNLFSEDVHQLYFVVRRRRGSSPAISEEHARSALGVFGWLVPQLIAGEA